MSSTLGVQLILGGSDFKTGLGANQLRGLLESLRPAFPEQIVVINSGIDKESKALLRQESVYRKAVGLAPVEIYKYKWKNDFADARNLALAKCKTDWWMWADGDDFVEGADNIRKYIDTADSETGGYFATYLYAFDEYGNVITQHDRERVFRSSIGWEWAGRIHEVTYPHHSFTWQKMDDVAWVHQRGLEIKSDRNLPILKEWYQDEPDNIRVWLYLGNQYFAEGSWGLAGPWYDRVWRDKRASPIDRYAAMTYAARAWRNAEDTQRAIIADMAGITEFPEWADAYIGMCENFIRLKEWTKGLAMGQTALTKDPPPSVMFINHLDYTWRLQNDLAICFAGTGDTASAYECAELALSFRPKDVEGQENLRIYGQRLEKERALDALDSDALDQDSKVALAQALPDDIRRERKARDVWVPAQLDAAYRGTQPRIVFYCGPSLENWYADTPYTTGIGGSETAVVEVARRLAQDGWKPIVYNSCGQDEGEYDGVTYAHWERFRAEKPSDVFVAWRNPNMIEEDPQSPNRWLWMHDLHSGDRMTEKIANGYTKILGVSPWHSEHMKALYPFLDGLDVDHVPNGVNLERFSGDAGSRDRFRFVYASSPDRGLATLLKFWPYLRKAEPEANLHIFYGWESFLKSAQQNMPDLYRLRDMIMELGNQPGVHWRGRVSQDELAKEFLQADMWAHPTSFLETFCITAVEAMAANLKIVTTSNGNLPYVIGNAGVCIPGYAGSIAYGRQFLQITHGMLADMSFRAQFHNIGPQRAKLFTWDRAMDRWNGLLKMAVKA